MAVGKNRTWKKVKGGKQYYLPYNIEAVGKISSGEEDGKFGEENQD